MGEAEMIMVEIRIFMANKPLLLKKKNNQCLLFAIQSTTGVNTAQFIIIMAWKKLIDWTEWLLYNVSRGSEYGKSEWKINQSKLVRLKDELLFYTNH